MAQIDTTRIEYTNPSARTIAERKKFAGLVDDFATFEWDKIDMFNEFGMFIINDKKGSLKFYNGASFKNEYSKPQFQDGYTNISGISFDTQKISFQVGVYWISIEDYRILMNFLHPYKVSFLKFSFEPDYGYQCKLAEIKDSTRHIVGKEGSNISENESTNLKYSQLQGGDGQGYRYYTELQLTFEVIGAQCAKSEPYKDALSYITYDGVSSYFYRQVNNAPDSTVSDLPMPLQISFNVANVEGTINIRGLAWAYYNPPNNSVELFSITLKNLKNTDQISLTYDSEQGLLYWSTGDKKNILSLLSTNDTGKRIVDSLDVKQFYWPGQLDHPEIKSATKWAFLVASQRKLQNVWYTRQKRTNVI